MGTVEQLGGGGALQASTLSFCVHMTACWLYAALICVALNCSIGETTYTALTTCGWAEGAALVAGHKAQNKNAPILLAC